MQGSNYRLERPGEAPAAQPARYAHMEDMMTEESKMSDAWEREHAAFRRREEERALVRAKLEPLLSGLAAAEAELSELSTFGADERYRVARARVELLRALRGLERAASGRSESNYRVFESLINRGA
jgi:hypothetical protein